MQQLFHCFTLYLLAANAGSFDNATAIEVNSMNESKDLSDCQKKVWKVKYYVNSSLFAYYLLDKLFALLLD